jgi:hypothetical protein
MDAGRRCPSRPSARHFAAAASAVEKAILNSLCMATTTVGYQGHIAGPVPLDQVVLACREAGVAGVLELQAAPASPGDRPE